MPNDADPEERTNITNQSVLEAEMAAQLTAIVQGSGVRE